MGVKITPAYLTYGKGGRPGRKLTPKGVVVHWTANLNPGANALANRNYFENHPENKVSAHYVVDNEKVLCCIPETEVAYHVGGKRYTDKAKKLFGLSPNSQLIGVEMCVNEPPRSEGWWKMYSNTAHLVADILVRHGWSINNVFRHYDITGKDCPKFFVDDATAKVYGFLNAEEAWRKFRLDVERLVRER